MPAPALIQEIDSMGCAPRPKAPVSKPTATMARPEPLQPMVNGKRHGLWVFFHPNGQKRSEQPYVDGLEEGVFRQWNADGVLLGEYTMKAGTGALLSWCEDGTLSSRIEKKDGAERGSFERWSCEGVLVEKGQSMGGRREEEWLQFDDAGELVARANYMGGQLQGVSSQYWPSRGQSRWDRTYVKGTLDGPTAWFDGAGRKVFEGSYRAGQPAGTWTAYFTDGTKREEMVLDPRAPKHSTWDAGGTLAVLIEMDATWKIVRVDGREPRGRCLQGAFRVQTDWISESPMVFETKGIVPCPWDSGAADATGKSLDPKGVAR